MFDLMLGIVLIVIAGNIVFLLLAISVLIVKIIRRRDVASRIYVGEPIEDLLSRIHVGETEIDEETLIHVGEPIDWESVLC